MKKYEYENATVYVTVPTDEQLENIRKATERYMKQVMKEKDSKWQQKYAQSCR